MTNKYSAAIAHTIAVVPNFLAFVVFFVTYHFVYELVRPKYAYRQLIKHLQLSTFSTNIFSNAIYRMWKWETNVLNKARRYSHTHGVWNSITFFLLFENKLRQMQCHYVGSNASILICRKLNSMRLTQKTCDKNQLELLGICEFVQWKWFFFSQFLFFLFTFRFATVSHKERTY